MRILKGIEDSVESILKSIGLPEYITIGIYSGELEIETIDQLVMRLPGIYIWTDAIEYSKDDDKIFTIGFDIIVANQNPRGLRYVSVGDSQHIGVYEMIQEIYNIMFRSQIVENYSNPLLISAKKVVQSYAHNMLIYVMNYEITGFILPVGYNE